MRFASAVALCLLLAACSASGSGDAPRIPAGEPTDAPHRGDETLILYVGNESGEVRDLDFEISVDGKVVARDVIDRVSLVMPQPHKEIRLALAPGDHVLEARTRNGEASLSQRFALTGKQWACLSYWYYAGTPQRKPEPRRFEFEMHDKQPRFL